MSNKRVRQPYGPWWKQSTGGVAHWLLMVIVGALVVGGCVVVANLPGRPPTASSTPAPVPTYGSTSAPFIDVTVVGDSYTAGSAMNQGDEWWALVDSQNGIAVERYAVGGTGYASTREMDYGPSNFLTRLERMPNNVANLMFFGSINDGRLGYQATYDAAAATYTAAKAKWPEARLLAVGPASPTWPTPTAYTTSRDAVRDAAAASGVAFFDPIEARWFADAPELIGDDGIHPTDAGHEYLAARLGDVLRNEFPL